MQCSQSFVVISVIVTACSPGLDSVWRNQSLCSSTEAAPHYWHFITRLQALLRLHPPRLTGCSLANAFAGFFTGQPLNVGREAGLRPLTPSAPTLTSCSKCILFGNPHKGNFSPDPSLQLQVGISNCQFSIFSCLSDWHLKLRCLKLESSRPAVSHQLPSCSSVPYSQWETPPRAQADHAKTLGVSLDSHFLLTPKWLQQVLL